MRLHLFEFEDCFWFPDVLRQGQTDYLHFVISKLNIYKPAAPLVKEIMDKSGTSQIIDLCSGGGGGADVFQKNLEELGSKVTIILSDKFPNIPAFEKIKAFSGGRVDYVTESVDALNVPKNLIGMRTMFSAFHHFKPDDAKAILRNASESNVSIAVFEGAEKNILNFLGILLFTPIMFIISTPFMKPFKLSRIFFTYIIPLIPITTVWDGLVSILRMYSSNEMVEMAGDAAPKYNWSAGKAKSKMGNNILYLIGYPK